MEQTIVCFIESHLILIWDKDFNHTFFTEKQNCKGYVNGPSSPIYCGNLPCVDYCLHSFIVILIKNVIFLDYFGVFAAFSMNDNGFYVFMWVRKVLVKWAHFYLVLDSYFATLIDLDLPKTFSTLPALKQNLCYFYWTSTLTSTLVYTTHFLLSQYANFHIALVSTSLYWIKQHYTQIIYSYKSIKFFH